MKSFAAFLSLILSLLAPGRVMGRDQLNQCRPSMAQAIERAKQGCVTWGGGCPLAIQELALVIGESQVSNSQDILNELKRRYPWLSEGRLWVQYREALSLLLSELGLLDLRK